MVLKVFGTKLIFLLGFSGLCLAPKAYAFNCSSFISDNNVVPIFTQGRLSEDKRLQRLLGLEEEGVGLSISDLEYLNHHLLLKVKLTLEEARLGLRISRKLYELGSSELEVLKGIVKFNYDIYVLDYEDRLQAISEAYLYKTFLQDLYPGLERPLIIVVESAFQRVELPELADHLEASLDGGQNVGPFKRFTRALGFK